MKIKILMYSLITLAIISMIACGHKTTNLSEKEFVKAISNTDMGGGLQKIDVDLIAQLIENNPQTMDFYFGDVECDFYLP
jgi:hypothetical protein